MTKAELISALEWFKDDTELHIVVPHEALDDMHEILSLDSARYNLIPPRVELVAKRSAPETHPSLTSIVCMECKQPVPEEHECPKAETKVCTCGVPAQGGVTHRTDGPCYVTVQNR